jgi:hypothetical protein
LLDCTPLGGRTPASDRYFDRSKVVFLRFFFFLSYLYFFCPFFTSAGG